MIGLIFFGIFLLLGLYIYSKRQEILKDLEPIFQKILDQLPDTSKIKGKTKGKIKKFTLPKFPNISLMPVATGAIGLGVVLMVGYLVIGQVKTAMEQTANVSGTSLGTTTNTIFAGFGLIAVGIIVLAAFGIINIFNRDDF
jgi:hypothetical protein